MASSGSDSPATSRNLVVGVVTLAVLLSASCLILAVRQSKSLAKGRILELRPEAYRRIATVQQELSATIGPALDDVGLQCGSAITADDAAGDPSDPDQPANRESPAKLPTDDEAPDDEPVDAQPVWPGEAFVWDGQTWYSCPRPQTESAPRTDIERLQSLLQPRLDDLLQAVQKNLRPEPYSFFREVIAGKPVVVPYGAVRRKDGTLVVAAVVLDLDRLRRDLVEPLITAGGEFALVDARPEINLWPRRGDVWSELLGPMFPFWSVQPSIDFILEQEAAGMRQTLLYSSATLLGLVALLLAIRAMNRLAQHEITLSRMKSNFIAQVSHELKTPLALIRMFGETLLAGRVTSPDKITEYHEIITRESTRLTHLIDNILDFARIDAVRKPPRMEPMHVGQVVRSTYDSYRHELDHHAFEHRCIVADDLPEIQGDADAISQVVLNLISNAVKYSADDKFLAVDVAPETRRGRHGVLIAVRDRGIGIRPEDRAHLFDGFFRATDDRVRKRRGAGLGLALCKRIVDAHGGYIDVESRLVKGSEFRIFLPQNPNPQPSKESP